MARTSVRHTEISNQLEAQGLSKDEEFGIVLKDSDNQRDLRMLQLIFEKGLILEAAPKCEPCLPFSLGMADWTYI